MTGLYKTIIANSCADEYKEVTITCLQVGPLNEIDGLFNNSGNNEGKDDCFV